MNILDALEVLRTAPDSLLRSHSAQTISILRNVGARLRTDLLMSAARVEEPTEHTLNSSCRKRKRKSRTPSGPVDGIIQGLPQAISCLLNTRGRETESLLSRKRSAKEDRRAKDVRRVEGDPKPSVEDTILRVLAVRSFAFEFMEWQVGHEPRTRIEQLVCHVISPTPGVNPVKEGRRSAVAEFVGCQSQFFDFKELAKRSIHIGIKHLVFELVVKHHLQQLGLPSSCEAISALLAWNIQNFRIMRYEEMPALIRGLLSHKVPSLASSNLGNNSDEEQDVLSLLCGLTPWFNLLQADYQGLLSVHGAEVRRPNLVASPESFSTRDSRGSSTEARSTVTDDASENLPSEMALSAFELVPQLPPHGPGSHPPSEGHWREIWQVGMGGYELALAQANPPTTVFSDQDLIERMVTQPYDCREAVQIAFDASLGLENVSTLEYKPGGSFNG